MNLYRPKFRDRKTGELRESPTWHLDFRDHRQIRQRFAGSDDKHATAELGRQIENLVLCRRRAIQPADKLWTWLMGLPADIQERLVKLDLAERSWFPAFCQAEPLSVWVDDFEAWLRNSKAKSGFHRNAGHIGTTMGRIRAIVDGCGLQTWGDIRRSDVETYLGGLSVALGTLNGYIGAFREFCTWCVRDGRAEYSPVAYLDRVTVPTKERRRPLDFEEVCGLLKVAANGPKRFKLSGIERAIAYRVGIETGYRRNELAQLTASGFDLDKATVSLPAEFSKDRRDSRQPISIALASRLAGFLAGMGPQDRPFGNLPHHTAYMIQFDAGRAGLPILDDQCRELVFHSLRHTLRTELERARVSDGVIDSIMRHKPGGVGKRFYRHVSEFERREAIERLPDWPWPADLIEQLKKAVS